MLSLASSFVGQDAASLQRAASSVRPNALFLVEDIDCTFSSREGEEERARSCARARFLRFFSILGLSILAPVALNTNEARIHRTKSNLSAPADKESEARGTPIGCRASGFMQAMRIVAETSFVQVAISPALPTAAHYNFEQVLDLVRLINSKHIWNQPTLARICRISAFRRSWLKCARRFPARGLDWHSASRIYLPPPGGRTSLDPGCPFLHPNPPLCTTHVWT
ncbi:hypothetical protein FB451DRAFT_1396359 [Mycena latifolia]|nr:hypothetical protein FB451DRAFT_1396359 [Mycena latifolia]